MSPSETTSQRNSGDLRRDLLIWPALIVIILVEFQMNGGVWRLVYPVLAVGLLSPFAQKSWSVILIVAIVLVSVLGWQPSEGAVSSGFFAVRIAFVWIMLVQGKLLATHRVVEFLGKMLTPYTGTLRKLLIAAVIVLIFSVVFFTVHRPYIPLCLAVFIAYVASRLPKTVTGTRTRVLIGLPEIGLVIASAIVCLALFELSVRLLLPSAPVVHGDIFKPHPRARFSLAENGRGEHVTEQWRCNYVISDQGFRDHHYDKKDDSEYRILCLGDSMTMGLGVPVDETYPKALERALAEKNLSRAIEVINAGTIGYGVWQELILLEEKGFALEPDLVILQIVPDNDIRDELVGVGKVMRSYDVAWQLWVRTFRQGRKARIAQLLSRHSRGFAFIHSMCAQLRERALPYLRPRFRKRATSMPPPEFGPAQHAVYPEKFYSVVRNSGLDLNLPPPEKERPFYLEPSLKMYYPELEEGWALMEESMGEIAKRCRDKGVGFLIFSAPMKYVVYPEKFYSLVRDYNLDPSLYDLHKVRRLERELCERNGWDYVETLDRFIEEGRQDRALFLAGDAHWTQEGNALCAQILCDRLLKGYLRKLMITADQETQ